LRASQRGRQFSGEEVVWFSHHGLTRPPSSSTTATSPSARPSATTLDRRTRIGLDRDSELGRRRIADRGLLEVKRADNGISARIFHLLVPVGAFGLLLFAEDEHETLHFEP